jgi:hypothetical protein
VKLVIYMVPIAGADYPRSDDNLLMSEVSRKTRHDKTSSGIY